MRFAHDPSVREAKDGSEPTLVSPTYIADEGRFTDLILQTRLGQDRLLKKVLGLAREARTLEEEQGINALYLAVGFLRWFEDEKSEIERSAPLILLPVSLRRNERTSTYDLEIRGEDIVTNEPLKHRFADDFGIKLPEIPETEEWNPSSYFDIVGEAVSAKARWSIDRDGMQLGFFSFAKLLMVKDLEPDNWPTDITEHPILAGLLMDGFASEPDDFPDVGRLDALFAPADLIQVVDADSSQTLVIETVRKGRNLVVQGPPGTGKSQTITNIIAAAAHDGKTVLFVAEKMAALNVVHDRLKAIGLRDICLELHSRSANKRIVVEELGRTLSAAGTLQMAGDAEELTRLRDKLNRVAEVMHRPVGETGLTPYRAISTLIRLNEQGFAPSDLFLPNVESWNREQLDSALSAAKILGEITAKAGPRMEHPFFGVRRLDLLPTDRQRLKPKLESLLGALTEADRTAAAVAGSLGIQGPRSASTSEGFAGVIELIATLPTTAVPFAFAIAQHGGIDRAVSLAEAGSRFDAVKTANGALFTSTAVVAKNDHLRSMLATGHGFFGRLGGAYRNASAELSSLIQGPLPKKQSERLALLDKLMDLQQVRGHLLSHEALGAELLGGLWQGESTDFAALSAAASWLRQLLHTAVDLNASSAVGLRKYDPADLRTLRDQVANKGTDAKARAKEVLETLDLDLEAVFAVSRPEEIPFDKLSISVRLWLENIERLDEWSHLEGADAALRELAGAEVADAVGSGGGETRTSAFNHSLYPRRSGLSPLRSDRSMGYEPNCLGKGRSRG